MTLVIIFAALGIAYTVFVVQMANMITGIPGASFLFVIGYAIFISAQLLIYEGRRWRFFVSTVLFILLIIPTSFAGAPFDVLARMPLIVNAFIADLLFNSMYGFFGKRSKLLLLTLLFSMGYHLMSPFISMMFYYLFYHPAVLVAFSNLVLLMSPVIIIESIAGGYIGYKVYKRVEVFYAQRIKTF